MKVTSFAGIAILGVLLTSAAQAETFESLEGKSIVYVFREKISWANGNVSDNTWSGKVYLSPTGHVFFRHHGSSHFGNNRSESNETSFDTEGDRDGNGNGRRTNYRWDGNGFSRTWTQKGTQITQAITVEGGACSSSIQRNPFPGTVLGQSGSCRIVAGNALGR